MTEEGALWRAARRVYRLLHGRKLRLAAISMAQRLRGASVVNAVGHRLDFDPADLRGRKLFRSGGALDEDAVRLWNWLAGRFAPTLLIDVGANYGEVALSRQYPAGTALHLVEANPRVARYLRRNAARACPSASVHVGAASDHAGTLRLRMRSTLGAPYSGTSSVELRDHCTGSIEVPAFRLDARIPPGDRLLFKLDVEGHELQVLRGMAALLETEWIGMCEVTSLTPPQIEQLHDGYRVLRVDRATLATRPSHPDRPLSPADVKDVILLPRDHRPAWP